LATHIKPLKPDRAIILRVEADMFTIEGVMNLTVPEGMEVSHVEVSLSRYRRSFTLSKELDTEKVIAELNQGVLKLRIPKAEYAQPSRIAINVA
jgi:HSP20 family molecular chaperone IbpA